MNSAWIQKFKIQSTFLNWDFQCVNIKNKLKDHWGHENDGKIMWRVMATTFFSLPNFPLFFLSKWSFSPGPKTTVATVDPSHYFTTIHFHVPKDHWEFQPIYEYESKSLGRWPKLKGRGDSSPLFPVSGCYFSPPPFVSHFYSK